MQDNQQIDPILDEILDAAKWPEAGHDRLGRLEQRWDQLRRRQRVVVGSAIAASFLLPLAVAIGFLALRTPAHRVEQRDTVQAVPARPVSQEPLHEGPVAKVEKPQPKETQRVRAANTYERTMLLLHRARMAKARRAEKTEAENPFVVAIAAVDSRPEDAAAVARRLAETYPDGEARLLALLQMTQGSKREAVIRLLAPLATRRSLAVLLESCRQGGYSVDAAEAVLRLCTATELAALARDEADSNLARTWMAALAGRESPDAARQFLALVEDPIHSITALSTCSSASRQAVEVWFAALSSRRVATRMAAARALGALNDPGVSARLARLAINGTTGPEAMAGLLTSTDEVAEEFRRFARDDVRLWPTLRAIDLRLRRDAALN